MPVTDPHLPASTTLEPTLPVGVAVQVLAVSITRHLRTVEPEPVVTKPAAAALNLASINKVLLEHR